jgi:hypothetical protein
MNPYLAKLRGLNFEKQAPSGTDKTDKTYLDTGFVGFVSSKGSPFSKNEPPFGSAPRPVPANRFRVVLRILEGRCPDQVEPDRWQRAVADGQTFLAAWGEQAQALGWTSRDLFGLHTPADNPAPSYRRLSRYDHTGLVWLLQGRPVVALTEATAAIQNPTGNVTVYRKNNKPALGPVGDSLDDFA